jgi:hypothetical protein
VEQWKEEEGIETTFLKKSNLMQDSVGNEKKGYPVHDPNETMINITKEPSDAHKKPSKKKSWNKSLRNSWRRY